GHGRTRPRHCRFTETTLDAKRRRGRRIRAAHSCAAPARSDVRSAPERSALPKTRRLVRIETGGQVIRRGSRRSHLAENKLFRCVLRWNRRLFWPESYNSESHDDPDLNFNE